MATSIISPQNAAYNLKGSDTGWYPDGESVLTVKPGLYRTNPTALPAEGVVGNQYGMILILRIGSDYQFIVYIGVNGQSGVYQVNGMGGWHQTST